MLRAANRLSLVLATGVRWERLTASHDPGVEFLYCTYPVGGESAPANDLVTHDGSEYGVILKGRCGATVGESHYELEAGEARSPSTPAPPTASGTSATTNRCWRSGPWSAATATPASAETLAA